MKEKSEVVSGISMMRGSRCEIVIIKKMFGIVEEMCEEIVKMKVVILCMYWELLM